MPLQGDTFAAVYEAHRYGKLDFSLVPPAEQAVLRRATNPNSERRFDSSADFVQALRDVTDGGGRKGVPTWVALLSAAVAAACVLAGLGMWYWQSKPVELTLTFDTPNAKVQIAEQEFTADDAGKLTVEVPQDAQVEIMAAGNEGRTDSTWTIQPAEFEKQREFEFAIPYTAVHHADEATRFLAAGQVDKAVDAYVSAIKAEPDNYARLPEPALLEMPALALGRLPANHPQGRRDSSRVARTVSCVNGQSLPKVSKMNPKNCMATTALL